MYKLYVEYSASTTVNKQQKVISQTILGSYTVAYLIIIVKSAELKLSIARMEFTSQKVIPPRHDNISLKFLRPKPGDKF